MHYIDDRKLHKGKHCNRQIVSRCKKVKLRGEHAEKDENDLNTACDDINRMNLDK